MTEQMPKPQIEYPCEWCYTVIGCDEAALRAAAAEALAGKEYAIAPSNRSKAGRYVSMNITMHVCSEDERNAIFKNLTDHAAIKMVI
jgi:putative lipoic acid-binding regulatory protein